MYPSSIELNHPKWHRPSSSRGHADPLLCGSRDSVRLRQIVLSDWFRAERCWQTHSSHADPLSSLLPPDNTRQTCRAEPWQAAMHPVNTLWIQSLWMGGQLCSQGCFPPILCLSYFSAQLPQLRICGVICEWRGLCSGFQKVSVSDVRCGHGVCHNDTHFQGLMYQFDQDLLKCDTYWMAIKCLFKYLFLCFA